MEPDDTFRRSQREIMSTVLDAVRMTAEITMRMDDGDQHDGDHPEHEGMVRISTADISLATTPSSRIGKTEIKLTTPSSSLTGQMKL
jgi:hypothetical protein